VRDLLPLPDLKVVDMTDGRGAGCGRLLADLGLVTIGSMVQDLQVKDPSRSVEGMR
jgi:hypothetical protein